MKLVEYDRVSTEDKGQDPGRQMEVIQAWAARNGHEIVARFVDEGTSGGVPAMQRQFFREAIERAKELEADGIVVIFDGPESYDYDDGQDEPAVLSGVM